MNNFLSPPNALSVFRLAAAPLLAAVFWMPLWLPVSQPTADVAAVILFGIAGITDFMDGYLARKHGQKTPFGAVLDPTADKILIITSLLLLVEADRAAAGACMLIIGREVFVSALREWAAVAGIGKAVAVATLGKYKTAAQMSAVPCLFAADSFFSIDVRAAGTLLLYLAAFLSVWSMAAYCRSAWFAWREKNHVGGD